MGELEAFELDEADDFEVEWDENDIFDLVDDAEDRAVLLGDRALDYDWDYDQNDYPYGFGRD